MPLSRGQRPSYWSNATWLAPSCEGPVTPPGSKSRSRAEGSRRKLGGPASGRCVEGAVRVGKGKSRKLRRPGGGKGDEARVAVRPVNRGAQAAAEPVERRAEAK